MTWLFKIAAVFAGLYVVVALAIYLGQRRLLYFPDPVRTPPAGLGLAGVEEVVLATSDGERIIAWWARARPGQPTLLYFHGNGGSLAFRAERIRRYHAAGRGILMMSYRGYSGSTGSPSEAANVADAALGYRYLIANGVPAHDIILYGESLGTGVAVQTAARMEVGGVILDAPYTSVVDVGAAVYPFLPVRWLAKDRYDSLAVIGEVRAPVLVVHGERDTVIPVSMGRQIHAAVTAPKEIVTYPLAGHDDHSLHGSYEAINGWIDRLRAAN